MSRPGTTITRSETRVSRAAPTATGPWFIVGATGTADTVTLDGPRKPVHNLTEYATRFGSRASHVNDGGGGAPMMYDQAEFYFRRGGSELYVAPATFNATPSTYETNIAASLDKFTRDLGPGQVSVPGRTTAATRLAVANHALATNRIAILASTNTATVATLTGDATIASITEDAEERTSLWTPWITVAGLTSGTTRTVSPECLVAGSMARNDGDGVSQNQPSAGIYGIIDEALDVAASFNEADRATLNVNGVNVLRKIYDGVRIYGYRTLADPTTNSQWVNLGNARLFMALEAVFDAVAERFVFREIDGQGHMFAELQGELTGEMLPYWQKGSLFGATPDLAFRVDTGPEINTSTTIANKQILANIVAIPSEFAEEVVLSMVKAGVTEVLA